MKAFHVCPDIEEVYEVNLTNNPDEKLSEIYKLCGCDCIDIVRIHPNEVIFVDDTGRLTYPNKFGYFQYRTYDAILAGNSVILGIDNCHNSRDSELTLEEVKKNIVWIKNPPKSWVLPNWQVVFF